MKEVERFGPRREVWILNTAPGMTRRTLAVLLFAASCAPGPDLGDAEPAALSQPIVGGVLANGDPAVVALTENGFFFCTGALIGPQTVLTAASCIVGAPSSSTYRAVFGSSLSAPTQSAIISTGYVHPQFSTSTAAHDVAVLRLSAPVTGVTPLPLYPVPLTSSDVGRMIRHVGFGAAAAGQSSSVGTKREATYAVRDLRTYHIESGASGKQTCDGDSGGPALLAPPGQALEHIAGVISFGDANCALEGFDARVDIDLQWIRNTAGSWDRLATCATDGLCVAGCAPVDQDCACQSDGTCSTQCTDPSKDPDCVKECGANGVCATHCATKDPDCSDHCSANGVCSVDACPTPDPDCVAPGRPCTGELQCQGRICTGDPQNPQPYCTMTCSGSCPDGLECRWGRCVLPQRREVDVGEPCDASTFCRGGAICVGEPGGPSKCGFPSDVGRPTDGLAPEQASPRPGCASVPGPVEWLALLALLLSGGRRAAGLPSPRRRPE